MLAAQNDHADTVKLLLEAGASTEAKSTVSKRISICKWKFNMKMFFFIFSFFIFVSPLNIYF